jgi:hypothetical protein
VLMAKFVKSLKRESPQLYESWGRPTLGKYLRHRQFLAPFSATFMFRKYRHELEGFPNARAWGSWLFLAYWAQMVAAAIFFLALARTFI